MPEALTVCLVFVYVLSLLNGEVHAADKRRAPSVRYAQFHPSNFTFEEASRDISAELHDFPQMLLCQSIQYQPDIS
jgi:hypothetical protein